MYMTSIKEFHSFTEVTDFGTNSSPAYQNLQIHNTLPVPLIHLRCSRPSVTNSTLPSPLHVSTKWLKSIPTTSGVSNHGETIIEDPSACYLENRSALGEEEVPLLNEMNEEVFFVLVIFANKR